MDTKIFAEPPLIGTPRFRALADRLCEAISDGRLQPGAKLPTVRDLAWHLGIGPGAVARAYRLGIDRGLLEATVGRGTFVRAAGDQRPHYAIDHLLEPGEDGTVDLRGNQAVDVGQDVDIGQAITRLIEHHDGRPPLTGYRWRDQDPEAIETLAGWLRDRGEPAEAARLLVTSGAQAGLMACYASLSRGGSGVILSTPTLHPGLLDGAAALNIRMETVASDGEGFLPDALDAACTELHPDAIQVTSTLHNPTLAIMSETRRREIAAVAERHGVALVEDDVYGHLLDDRLPSFASLLPERTYYVSSMSKCVAAGIRTGLVLVPPGRTTATLRAYQALAHQTPWLVKGLAAELVASGTAERIRQRVRAEIAERVAFAASRLGPFGARTHPAASFIYLPLPEPWSSAEFVAAAASFGVLVPPTSIYRIGRGGPDFTRIALGGRSDAATLLSGIDRLAAVLAEGPAQTCVAT
ncbi:MAG: PLP-dependent aminotransferase family protein [Pseudomonadota bacterium]